MCWMIMDMQQVIMPNSGNREYCQDDCTPAPDSKADRRADGKILMEDLDN